MALGIPWNNFTAIGFYLIMAFIDIAAIAILVSSSAREGWGPLLAGVIFHTISTLISGMTSISLIAGGPPRDIPGFQNLMLITNTLSRLCLIIGAVLAVMGLNQLIQRNSFLEKLLDDENQDDT